LTRDQALRLLGLSEGYSEEELKRAYREKARRYHPDVAGAGSTELFIQLRKAYELLSTFQSGSVELLLTHQTIFDIVKA